MHYLYILISIDIIRIFIYNIPINSNNRQSKFITVTY